MLHLAGRGREQCRRSELRSLTLSDLLDLAPSSGHLIGREHAGTVSYTYNVLAIGKFGLVPFAPEYRRFGNRMMRV